AITGRALLDESARLIMPATPDGKGADQFVITASAGPAIRTLLLGLLPDVSLESARRTAASGYLSVLDTLSLGDHRREDQQIDAVIRTRPEVILVAGGTENGATDALARLIETVGLACHLLPPEVKAKVLYLGNAKLRDRVAELLGGVAVVHSAPNVQPELNVERLTPARAALAKLYEELRLEQIGGLQNIAPWAGGRLYPTAQAEGHIIRYFSQALGPGKGVLGVDVGSASTTLAAAFGGDLTLNVFTDLGVGVSAATALKEAAIEHFTRWVPYEISAEAMRDFILNKALYPHTVPADVRDSYLEYALARQVMRAALRRARRDWPRTARALRPDLLPSFEAIFGGGAVLTHAPRPGLAALMMLDGLQPAGLTELFLDGHHLAAALGALAYVNPTAVVQILSSDFMSLGTAISVITRGSTGSVACTATLTPAQGPETSVEVKFGTIEVLPLPLNQTGKLTLKPRMGVDLGFGPGRGKTIKELSGGAVGVIIDARGRPIRFPDTPEKRCESVQQWIWKVGGL
ncbi:MAG: glutamate mutase L, partial [Anaerolineales bacterium]